MSVLTVPSRSEDTLPTSAIEAAFFGIPVVASDRGGLKEIVGDQVTGIIFPSGNVERLAAAIKQLLENSNLRDKLGRAARDRAVEKFSRDRFVGKFFQLLEAA